MPGLPDCPDCDFRDAPEVCHSAVTGHRRFCDLAHVLKSPGYRELIRRKTMGEPEPERAVAPCPPTVRPRSAKPRVALGVRQRPPEPVPGRR